MKIIHQNAAHNFCGKLYSVEIRMQCTLSRVWCDLYWVQDEIEAGLP